VLVAAGEAVANAVEHGCDDADPTRVTLDAHAAGPDLRLRVVDTGTWKTAPERPDATRGRGIAMMRALSDHTDIRTDRCGTTVEIYVRITG
jgi:anti-sigma regulatory factor (Ser/Thr protein kinase)